ncbi:MAG: hypothetical protein ACRDZR_06460 [Acidimicrobiales bacterium]
MSSAGDASELELVVSQDGSIPADQLRSLGLRPGTHLRVVESPAGSQSSPLGGSMPELPDLGWEDFEAGSELARRDAAAAWS